MHNLDNKNKKLKWYHFLLIFILWFVIFINMVLCVKFCYNAVKSEAYTNDVVSYANEQITDLTGTSWLLNDTITLAPDGWSLNDTEARYKIYNLNFTNSNNNYNGLRFQDYDYSLGDLILYKNDYENTKVYTYNNKWLNREYKTISITGGLDAINTTLINWFYQNGTLQAPQVQEYTISSNLINTNSNISLPLTITENDTISLEFTPTENNIFNTYQWTITPRNSYILDNLVEEPFKISFDISNVTSDLTINIEAIPYISLKGQWVLKDFNQMTITPTTILNNVNFSSNGYSYNNISALGGDYLRYYSDNLVVNVLSLLDNGLTSSPLAYLPTSTYNYNLITIDSDYYYGIYTTEYNLPSYLKNVTYFTEIFRPATQSDLDNIIYKNGQISILQNEYTFVSMFGALIDAPITALKGLLNFTFFGVNLFSFLTLFITLAVVYLCIKMLKGGRKDE